MNWFDLEHRRKKRNLEESSQLPGGKPHIETYQCSDPDLQEVHEYLLHSVSETIRVTEQHRQILLAQANPALAAGSILQLLAPEDNQTDIERRQRALITLQPLMCSLETLFSHEGSPMGAEKEKVLKSLATIIISGTTDDLFPALDGINTATPQRISIANIDAIQAIHAVIDAVNTNQLNTNLKLLRSGYFTTDQIIELCHWSLPLSFSRSVLTQTAQVFKTGVYDAQSEHSITFLQKLLIRQYPCACNEIDELLTDIIKINPALGKRFETAILPKSLFSLIQTQKSAKTSNNMERIADAVATAAITLESLLVNQEKAETAIPLCAEIGVIASQKVADDHYFELSHWPFDQINHRYIYLVGLYVHYLRTIATRPRNAFPLVIPEWVRITAGLSIHDVTHTKTETLIARKIDSLEAMFDWVTYLEQHPTAETPFQSVISRSSNPKLFLLASSVGAKTTESGQDPYDRLALAATTAEGKQLISHDSPWFYGNSISQLKPAQIIALFSFRLEESRIPFSDAELKTLSSFSIFLKQTLFTSCHSKLLTVEAKVFLALAIPDNNLFPKPPRPAKKK